MGASYLQIMLFAALTLKSVVFDREFKYFVLIRYSKPRDMRKASRKVELSKAPRGLRYALTDGSGLFCNEPSTVESILPRPDILHVPQESLTELTGFSTPLTSAEAISEAPRSITWAPL